MMQWHMACLMQSGRVYNSYMILTGIALTYIHLSRILFMNLAKYWIQDFFVCQKPLAVLILSPEMPQKNYTIILEILP